jgi:cytochrome c oxidase subunit 1
MEPAVTSGARIGDRPRPKKNYLNDGKTFKSWALTVDHKRIGIMYLVGTMIAFLLGGIFALLVRLTLLTPQHTMFGCRSPRRPTTASSPARRHHGVPVHHSFYSRLSYELRTPSDAGAKDVAFPS